MKAPQRWISYILLIVTVGAGLGWAGSQNGDQIGGVGVFALAVAAAFVINWLAFIPSYLARTEAYFDLTGSVTYVSVAVGALLLSDGPDVRAWLAVALVAVWATRLGSFLFRRIRRDGRDGRFDKMKHDFWQFLMTWTLQGLWVSLTLASALVIITTTESSDLGVIGAIGLALWLVGFSIEVVADQQKRRFAADPSNKGRFINSGLWALSRHPNYFGEITLWVGMAVLALPVLSGWRWIALASPIFVTVLLTRISGIPILRRRAEKKWGNEAAFREYVSSTPVLIPWPRRRTA